jgi:hypothetical protein
MGEAAADEGLVSGIRAQDDDAQAARLTDGMNVRTILADKEAVVADGMRPGEFHLPFTLVDACDQGQSIEFARLQGLPHGVPSARLKSDGNLHGRSRRGEQLDGEAGRSTLGIDIGIGRKTDLRSDNERSVRLGPGETGKNQAQYECQSHAPCPKPKPPRRIRSGNGRRERPISGL